MKTAVVVGSGAGGCAAAAKLSTHFNVTLLEAGKAFKPFFVAPEHLEPLRRAGVFLDERMIQLLFPEMRILKTDEGMVHVNGKCIGGTTTLATGNALRYDRYLQDIGINLDAEFAELEDEVPTTQEHYLKWSQLTVTLFQAFEDLGLEPQVTPKFMEDANQCVACGRCVLGCKYGAKWTADKLLENKPNIEVISGAEVKQVLIENGRACGVLASCAGRTQTFEADVVVLAAGGLHTPVILNASGIASQASLFVDPVICIAAPWHEAHLENQLPMPFVSQREGYILSPYFDWLSFFFNKAWRMPSENIMSIMIKYADTSVGCFDGKRLQKPTTVQDQEIIEASIEETCQVFDYLGLKRKDLFMGTVNAGHPGGCLPLSATEATSLHHSILPDNLYVADASLFPRSIGNPPILTIMAIAKGVARRILEAHA